MKTLFVGPGKWRLKENEEVAAKGAGANFLTRHLFCLRKINILRRLSLLLYARASFKRHVTKQHHEILGCPTPVWNDGFSPHSVFISCSISWGSWLSHSGNARAYFR